MFTKTESLPPEFEYVKHLKSGVSGIVTLYRYRGDDETLKKIAHNQGYLVVKTSKESSSKQSALTYCQYTYLNELKIASLLDQEKQDRKYPLMCKYNINGQDVCISEFISYEPGYQTLLPKCTDLEDFMILIAQNKVYNTLGEAAFRQLLDHLASSMAFSLTQLHQQGMLHLDVALKNYLLDSKFTAVICDFGLSQQMDAIHPQQGIATLNLPRMVDKFLTPDAINYIGLKSGFSKVHFEKYMNFKFHKLSESSPIEPGAFYLAATEDGCVCKWIDPDNLKEHQRVIPFVRALDTMEKRHTYVDQLLSKAADNVKHIFLTSATLYESTYNFRVHYDLFALKLAIMEMIFRLLDPRKGADIDFLRKHFLNNKLLLDQQLLGYYNELLSMSKLNSNPILSKTLEQFLTDNFIYFTSIPNQKLTLEEVQANEFNLLQSMLPTVDNQLQQANLLERLKSIFISSYKPMQQRSSADTALERNQQPIRKDESKPAAQKPMTQPPIQSTSKYSFATQMEDENQEPESVSEENLPFNEDRTELVIQKPMTQPPIQSTSKYSFVTQMEDEDQASDSELREDMDSIYKQIESIISNEWEFEQELLEKQQELHPFLTSLHKHTETLKNISIGNPQKLDAQLKKMNTDLNNIQSSVVKIGFFSDSFKKNFDILKSSIEQTEDLISKPLKY